MEDADSPLLEERSQEELPSDETPNRNADWRVSFCLLGAYCCYQIAYNGVFTSLVLYLKRVRQEDNAIAAATSATVLGTGYSTSFLAAYLSDGSLGRYWSCVLILVLYFLLQVKASAFFTCSLYLTALGYGWLIPTFTALAGDQFHGTQRNTFYNRQFVFGFIGDIFSSTVLMHLENVGHWTLGYWISSGAVGIAVLCLLAMHRMSCRLSYQKKRENPFKGFLQVFVASIRKYNVKVPLDFDVLKSDEGDKLVQSKDFRFLDKAAIITDTDLQDQGNRSPWRLCNLEQVEEVKSILRVLPMWLVVLCNMTTMSQLMPLYLEQGDTMNWTVGSIQVAPASMPMVYMISATAFAALSDMWARWWSTARGKQARAVASILAIALTQIGTCLVSLILSILVAMMVETAHLAAVDAGTKLSILWLIPQYVLIGISIVSGTVGEANFFYSTVPPGIRSLSSSVPTINRGLGSFLGASLITVVTVITTANGSPGWIASNLDQGHLNYFYLLLAGIVTVSLAFFLFIAFCCSYPLRDDLVTACNML